MTPRCTVYLLPAVLFAGCGRQELLLLPEGSRASDAAREAAAQPVDSNAVPEADGAPPVQAEPLTGFTCLRESDCGHYAHCDDTLQRCVECTQSEHCALGFYCDRGTRTCVQPCSHADQCNDWRGECHPSWQFCVECTENAHCIGDREGPVCRTGTGRCVECLDDTTCFGNRSRCDTARHRCQECVVDRDCPGSGICEQGRCFLPY